MTQAGLPCFLERLPEKPTSKETPTSRNRQTLSATRAVQEIPLPEAREVTAIVSRIHEQTEGGKYSPERHIRTTQHPPTGYTDVDPGDQRQPNRTTVYAKPTHHLRQPERAARQAIPSVSQADYRTEKFAGAARQRQVPRNAKTCS